MGTELKIVDLNYQLSEERIELQQKFEKMHVKVIRIFKIFVKDLIFIRRCQKITVFLNSPVAKNLQIQIKSKEFKCYNKL